MDYQGTSPTSASTNYDDNRSTTGTEIVRLYEAFAEVICSEMLDEFEKMCALLKAEKWENGNDYPRHAFGNKERFRCFIIVRKTYYRRMMFCVSGHLPWRDRKRLKDR